MSGHAVRFRPPRVEASPALVWMLTRSFGPPPRAPAAPGGTEEAATRVDLARRFRLGARIAARQSRAVLEAELGREAAGWLLADRRIAVAGDMAWSVVAEDLARAAAEAGLPIVFLKYLGLRLAGVVEAGMRSAADCDLLAAPEHCEQLAAVLLGRGFSRSATRDQEHQLPPLYHPSGAAVEIHRIVLGVQPPAGPAADAGGGDATRSVTLHDLRALSAAARDPDAALLVPVAHLPGHVFHPSRPLLAAHALVHGIAQHGWAPHAYPALRMLADLTDLGLGRPEGEDLLAALAPWVARAVPMAEARAARELVVALEKGDLAPLHADPKREGGAGALLHHLLAGTLDDEYRAGLRIPMLLRPLTDRPAPLGALVSIGRALVPGAGEMDLLHDPASAAAPASASTPSAASGSQGRPRWLAYLARPFSLLGRLVRYFRAARATRRKGVR